MKSCIIYSKSVGMKSLDVFFSLSSEHVRCMDYRIIFGFFGLLVCSLSYFAFYRGRRFVSLVVVGVKEIDGYERVYKSALNVEGRGVERKIRE